MKYSDETFKELKDQVKKGSSTIILHKNMIEFLTTYNLNGIFIGIATFLIIGIFHPLVIKGEYYFGVKCWWVFALMGIVSTIASVMIDNLTWSILLAVWGASSFWSIHELFEQRERVRKGWFPKRIDNEE